MREKIWKDCPSCGAQNSMVFKEDRTEQYKLPGGRKFKVTGIAKYVCRECKESIHTLASDRIIQAAMVEERAVELSKEIPACEIATVDEFVESLKVTRQAVHKMMNTGRLQYVFVGSLRLPLRKELKRLKEE